MDIFEIEQKETVSRKEVATRLRKLATQLAKGNEVKFEQGGMTMKVHVPDEVQLKVEVEAATDQRELEIELTW
jgi:amphi-Trp domain-containing protein